MALQVWLPLRGDLKNQGLSDITVTNSGATVAENGKIGQCYSFNGSSSRISCSSITLTYPISICGWFNCTSYTSATQYWISYNTDSGGTVGHSIGIGMYTSQLSIWYAGQVVSLRAITTGQWYHIAVTINNSKECKTYLNGELINTRTFSSDQPASKWITIGARSSSTTGGVGGAAYFFNGKANDIRIYDHCLSPKEIKEISKGLVLHYKLDDDFSNLRSSMTSFTWNQQVTLAFSGNNSTITNSNNEFTISAKTGTSNTTSFSVSNSTAQNYLLSNNDHKFYMCAKIKSESNITIRFGCIYYVGSSTGETRSTSGVLTNTYKKFSVITSGSYNGTTYGISCKDTSIDGLSFVFKDAMCIDLTVMYGEGKEPATVEQFELDYYKLFEKQLNYESYNSGETVTLTKLPIYDSSGYENNGIITGTLSTDNDSPRYNYSTQFSSGAKITPSIFPSFLTDECTVSMWVKLDQLPSSSPGRTMLYTAWYGFSCEVTSSGSTYFRTYLTNGQKDSPSGTLTINNWIHWVGVKSSTGVSLYLNGTLIGTSLTTDNFNWKSVSSNSVASYNNNYYLYGKLSDLKLYATALSAEDIKELYNTSAIIDNAKNNLAYQFNENGQTPNLLDLAQRALINKQWKDCLFNSSYQPKAVVTLTDNGLRVYREPNNTSTTSGSGEGKQSNWGGFVLTNTNNMFGLQDGHTYLIQVDVKGKSDRTLSDYGWRHHVGWNYTNTGIAPAPTNTVLLNPITSNFNTEEWQQLSYKFTISDSVYKVATTTYQYHTEGETYLAYYQFKFGWTYGTTGEIGTDVYFSNLRMFDITFIPKEININKQGILDAFQLSENENVAFIDYYCGSTSNQFIEI